MELILDPELQKYVEQQIASGKYASASEMASALVQKLMDEDAKAAAKSSIVEPAPPQENRE